MSHAMLLGPGWDLGCDLCKGTSRGVHVGDDASQTLLCPACAGKQPNPSVILDVGKHPCLCGCTVEDVQFSCEEHGMPTWATWLGWV